MSRVRQHLTRKRIRVFLRNTAAFKDYCDAELALVRDQVSVEVVHCHGELLLANIDVVCDAGPWTTE